MSSLSAAEMLGTSALQPAARHQQGLPVWQLVNTGCTAAIHPLQAYKPWQAAQQAHCQAGLLHPLDVPVGLQGPPKRVQTKTFVHVGHETANKKGEQGQTQDAMESNLLANMELGVHNPHERTTSEQQARALAGLSLLQALYA